MSHEPLCQKATLEDRIARARWELEQEEQEIVFWQKREAWEYAETLRPNVVAAELRLNVLLEQQRQKRQAKVRRYQETRQSIIDGVMARLGA